MSVPEFMRDFHKRLYEVAPEEVKREITKQERTIKHALYMVVGSMDRIRKEQAVKLQELFHVKIDQMAGDYHTWKRGGCKAYAKPKQYVSGRVAGASKKAFDQALNSYLVTGGVVVPAMAKAEEGGEVSAQELDRQSLARQASLKQARVELMRERAQRSLFARSAASEEFAEIGESEVSAEGLELQPMADWDELPEAG